MGSLQVLQLWIKVDPGVMAMKKYLTFLRAPDCNIWNHLTVCKQMSFGSFKKILPTH